MPGKIISLLGKVNPTLPSLNYILDPEGFAIGWEGPNGVKTIFPASNSAAGAEDGITAGSVQTQAGAFELNYRNYRVATVTVAADSVTLPQGIPGMRMTIQSAAGVNAMNVFPALGDKINALATNAAFSLLALRSAEFICTKLGQWITNPTVAS